MVIPVITDLNNITALGQYIQNHLRYFLIFKLDAKNVYYLNYLI